MPPSELNMSVTEDKENRVSNPSISAHNNINNAAKNRYSPLNKTPGSSGAKKKLSPAAPAMPWRANSTTAKGFIKERKPLTAFQTPNTVSALKHGQVKQQHGDTAKKISGSNPDEPKRRLNGIGSIARGFINRDRPVLRRSLSSNASLEAPKGCFGFLHSAKPVSKTAPQCSSTASERPVVGGVGVARVRACDSDADKPKESNAESGPKKRSNSLPRSNSDGSSTLGKRNGGTGWSGDRSLRRSNDEILKRNSGSRSLKSSGEISVKGSRDRDLKSSGESGLKGFRGTGVGNSGGKQISRCPTPKNLTERKISSVGSLRRTTSLNGMKKNCGLASGTAGQKQDENFSLPNVVAGKNADSSKKSRELENNGISGKKGAWSSSMWRRAEEIGANSSGFGSPSVTRTPAVQMIQATPSQKVRLNFYHHVTPACKLTVREGDFTPAHKWSGKYEDFTPADKLVKKDHVTPACKLTVREGDFTPAYKWSGKYEDFTPADKLVRKEDAIPPGQMMMGRVGEFTPAQNGGGKGDLTPVQNNVGTGGDFTPGQGTMHATPEQRTQVTPPVQPSISPEIHSQSLDAMEDAHHCFGAGHVMAPVLGQVRDRRKCRPRGILTVGEAKPIPFDENRRLSLIPGPAVASVRWMSPGEVKNLSSPENPQVSPSGFIPGFANLERTPPSGPSPPIPNLRVTLPGSSAESPHLCVTPTALSPEIPHIKATPPSGFSAESPHLGVTSPSALSPEIPDLEVTPQSGLTSEIPKFQSTPPSGFNPKFRNLQGTPSGFTPLIPNFLDTPPSGFSPKLPLQCGFNPDDTTQCSDAPGIFPSVFSSKISSRCGLNPGISSRGGYFHGNLNGFDLDIPIQCSASPDVFRPCILKPSPVEEDSCRQKLQMPILSSKDLAQLRISWREGLVSRIFELSRNDCCEWVSDVDREEQEDGIEFISGENHQLDCGDDSKLENPSQFGNNLELGAPFGSFEYMCEPNADKQGQSPLVASCLHQNKATSDSLVQCCISPASRAADAESMGTDDVATSGDLDWTFCYKNQLFEEAA